MTWLIRKMLFLAVMLATLLTIIVGGSFAASAQQEIYSFNSVNQQQRFAHLTAELRCLVCQNESLADSTAGLAQDLRYEIYQQIQDGKDDAAIKQYLVSRYGQFILFKPAFNALTLVLWIFPFILLLLALTIVFLICKRRK